MPSPIPDDLFRRRYSRVTRLSRRFHGVFLTACLLLLALGLIRFRVWWLVPLFFGTYLVLYRSVFSRWSEAAILRRTLSATSSAQAEIRQAESVLGLHQVAYRYEWDGRRYTFFDFVSPAEAESLRPGQIADILLDPFRPRQSLIAPPKERIVG